MGSSEQQFTNVSYVVYTHVCINTCMSIATCVYMHNTSMLCPYLGLFLGCSSTFRQQNRRWVSSWNVASSVQITSLKPLCASCRYCLAHSSLFLLFSSLMSWQDALPRNVHPRVLRHHRIVVNDRLYPLLFKSMCS